MTSLRYAIRSLRRSPGFTSVAVLSLGIGLGLTTTMFAVLDALLNPPVPYPEPHRLHGVLWHVDTKHTGVTTGEAYRFIRDNNRSFDAIVPMSFSVLQLEDGGDSRDVFVGHVTASFFPTIAVPPVLGRVFTDADVPGENAVVDQTIWKRLFGTRRSLDGATVTLGGRKYPIIGVMPRGVEEPGKILLQLRSAADSGDQHIWRPLVRLRPGVTLEQASAEAAMLARRLTDMHNARLVGPFDFALLPITAKPGFLRPVHKAMVGAAVAVLLIACANLANLMLVRGLGRRREVALRLAMGAGRGVVVRQMFLESAIVAALGAAIGALLSIWGGDILVGSIPRDLEWIGIVEPQLSWRVFGFSALAAGGSAIVFGLIPIRVVRQVSLDEPLKDGATSTGRTPPRYSGLASLQIAIALILAMGSGLLVRTVYHAERMRDNFGADRLLTGFAMLRSDSSHAIVDRVRPAVLTRVRALPGVVDAALELTAIPPGRALTAEMSEDTRSMPSMSYPIVSPSYLRTMGLPVIEGRDFNDGDAAGSGAVILNAAAAARFYPHGGAVGRMLKLGGPASNGPWVPIVGVVRTATIGLPGSSRPFANAEVYVAGPFNPDRSFRLLIRQSQADAATLTAVTAAIQGADPGVVRGSVHPYLYYWRGTIASGRFLMNVFLTIAVVALVLSSVGLYGVLAYTVTRRNREFAIRVAVGATDRDLLRMLTHDTAVMVLAGTAVGAFVSFLVTPMLGDFLEGGRATDALTLVAAELVVLAAATLAALGPARRAMRADPMEILRAT